jgi:lipoic acid synthetase
MTPRRKWYRTTSNGGTLTRQVRIQAKYWRSMEVLKSLKQGGMRTKSSIMRPRRNKEEVVQTLRDLYLAAAM